MTDPAGEVICDASATNDACRVMGYGWVYDSPGWIIGGDTYTTASASRGSTTNRS